MYIVSENWNSCGEYDYKIYPTTFLSKESAIEFAKSIIEEEITSQINGYDISSREDLDIYERDGNGTYGNIVYSYGFYNRDEYLVCCRVNKINNISFFG